MKIEVEVWCNKCDKEMHGGEEMYHNPSNQLQACEYTCDKCEATVGVALFPAVEPCVPCTKVQ